MEIALPSAYAWLVFTAKFFRFRPFFAGSSGFELSNTVCCPVPVRTTLSISPLRSRRLSPLKEFGDKFDAGDSGDTDGEASVIDEESRVDTVVVGEDSAELSEFDVEVLPRG